MAAVKRASFRTYWVWPWLFSRVPMLRFPKAVYRYEIDSKARNRGAELYVPPNKVETAGPDKLMMRAATGTTRSEAYLIEYWKTFLRVSLSLWGSSLENAGNRMVVMGVAKNPMRTTKFTATP
jgi:hypothetical protein